jgi:hypothetical protein
LGTIDQAALGVLATVDKVGVVEGQLNGTVDNVVNSFDTQHEGVVLVADLVAPRAETATGPDTLLLELGQNLGEGTLTLQARGGVTVVEAAVVGGDDLITGGEHLGVDKTLNGLGKESLVVNGLHGRLGNLQHDGPVRTLLRLGILGLGAISKLESWQLLGGLGLVVGGVVGEDGGAVEGAVVLREVQPALVTDAVRAGTTDTNTNNVGGGVEELLGEGHELGVIHGLGEVVDCHGGNKLLVTNGGAISQGDGLVVGIDLFDLVLGAVAGVLLGDGVGNGDPDTTGTVASRETESSVGTPVTGGLVEDDVGGHSLDIGGSDTLTEPSALHLNMFHQYCSNFLMRRGRIYLGGGNGPDLVVVGSHEEVGNTGTHHADNPLIEVLGLGVGNTGLKGSINHAVNALDLLSLGQHGDVVLEGVGNPLLLAANVGDTLVGVPILIPGKGLVDAVVEVLIVGEDNVTTDIVQL